MRSLFLFAVAACAAHSHLDDPSRDAWQRPDELVAAMQLSTAMTVADVGAGTGYFTVRLARVAGQVIATDIDPAMREHLAARTRMMPNVQVAERLLPDSVDAILVVHVWHHVHDRAAFAADLAGALHPGGRIFVVDFTRDASHGPPPEMRLDPTQVVADLEGAGLGAKVSSLALPDQYVVEATRAPR